MINKQINSLQNNELPKRANKYKQLQKHSPIHLNIIIGIHSATMLNTRRKFFLHSNANKRLPTKLNSKQKVSAKIFKKSYAFFAARNSFRQPEIIALVETPHLSTEFYWGSKNETN